MKRNAFLIFVFMALTTLMTDAAVLSRSASRASQSRAPTMSAKINNNSNKTVSTTTATTQTQSVAQPTVVNNNVVTESLVFEPIENKTSQFDTILDNASQSNTDAAASSLAEMVRAQRAALDATSLTTTKATQTAQINACDTGLRSCMTDKCGKNFAKCSSDDDTIFGTKLDACRRSLTCTANEFKLFATEIKADRAQAIKLKAFNDILDCGNEYDQCILNQCGTTYAKCIGKRDGDTAISKCSSIANRCREMDNGLPNRAMSVFATLRQNAERQITTDEKQLYTMRDNMRSICQRIGAMFDDRSLDCVYTVNFYAGEDSTLYASKKLYAGSTFDCTPNWFGIDVTTFMDNAYRRTREQTSASSAMLGSGVGVAVGSLTSGAIDRAIDTKKADNALERAKCEQREDGAWKWNSFLGKCVEDKTEEKEAKKQARQQQRAEDKATGNTGIKKVANAVKNGATKVADGVKTAGGAVAGGVGAVGGAVAGMFNGGDDEAQESPVEEEVVADDGPTKKEKRQAQRKADQEQRQTDKNIKACKKNGGTWNDDGCLCPNDATPDTNGECPKPQKEKQITEKPLSNKEICERDGIGKWKRNKCDCPSGYMTINDIECQKVEEEDVGGDNTGGGAVISAPVRDGGEENQQRPAEGSSSSQQQQTGSNRQITECLNTPDIQSIYQITGKDYAEFKKKTMCYLLKNYCTNLETVSDADFGIISQQLSYNRFSCGSKEHDKTGVDTQQLRRDIQLFYDCNGYSDDSTCKKNANGLLQIPDPSTGKFSGTTQTPQVKPEPQPTPEPEVPIAQQEQPQQPATTPQYNSIYDISAKNQSKWNSAALQYLQDKYCVTPANNNVTCTATSNSDVRCKNDQYKPEYTANQRKADVAVICEAGSKRWADYAVKNADGTYSVPKPTVVSQKNTSTSNVDTRCKMELKMAMFRDPSKYESELEPIYNTLFEQYTQGSAPADNPETGNCNGNYYSCQPGEKHSQCIPENVRACLAYIDAKEQYANEQCKNN